MSKKWIQPEEKFLKKKKNLLQSAMTWDCVDGSAFRMTKTLKSQQCDFRTSVWLSLSGPAEAKT